MAKDKSKKGIPNKHLHARIAYLHRAAEYLTEQSVVRDGAIRKPGIQEAASKDAAESTPLREEGTRAMPIHSKATLTAPTSHGKKHGVNLPPSGLPLSLISHLRAVAHKAQIRLPQETKHSFCKTCNSPLIEGSTCMSSTENRSKGGQKPWAEVLVVKCVACGRTKRFPVGAKRQRRKGNRELECQNEMSAVVNAGGHEQLRNTITKDI